MNIYSTQNENLYGNSHDFGSGQMQDSHNNRGVVLFVEDHGVIVDGVRRSLEETGRWSLLHRRSPNEAWLTLEDMSKREFPAAVSIDLGLANKPNDPDLGLDLLQRIRARWSLLPLIIHSTIVRESEDIVRRVIAHGASYLYLGDQGDSNAYVALLPYIVQGYVVYSPTPAGRLQSVIATKPDPFSGHPDYWETLQLLNEGKTFSQVAQRHHLKEASITARVRKMWEVLETLGEIPNSAEDDGELAEAARSAPYRSAVLKWYRANRHRFVR